MATTLLEDELAVRPDFPGLTPQEIETFLRICFSLAEGDLVGRLLPVHHLSWRAFYRIVESSDQTREWYARARIFQAHQIAEQAINIADGTDELGKLYDAIADIVAEEMDPNHRRAWLNAFAHGRVQRDKIRTDARKWLASKLAPKLYGEKLDITSGGENLQAGVVVLPAPDAPLVPPADGVAIEQTTRVAVGPSTTQGTIAKLLDDMKQGRLR